MDDSVAVDLAVTKIAFAALISRLLNSVEDLTALVHGLQDRQAELEKQISTRDVSEANGN